MTDAPDPRAARLLLRTTGWILTLFVLALAAVMLVPTVLGYGRYVLVSGSMTGTYDTGSVVYTRDQPVSSLRVGDVITYAPPAGASPQRLVTHRIVSRRDVDGRLVFRTKGDANPSPDPWTFSLHDDTQAVVRFGVPDVGYVISAFSDRRLRILVVGVPAGLIALLALVSLLRDAHREARAVRDGDGDVAGAAPDDPGSDDAAGGTVAPPVVVPHTVFPVAHRLGAVRR